jgi:ABC-type transport system substrate-binding protein
MYRSGELDIAAVGANEVRGVKEDPQLRADLQSWPSAQLLFVGLSQFKIRPFRDPRVRQAFVQALDRGVVCDRLLAGAWTETSEIVPDGVPGHLGKNLLPYDPARARELIAAAGFPNGQGFPPVAIAVSGSTESTAAEALAAQWTTNLGVKVDVHRVEDGEFLAGLKEHRWDGFLSGWTADYLSAEQWLYHSLGRNEAVNYTGYFNPAFESALAKARLAETMEEEVALWQEANRIATADAALVPLARGRFTFLIKPTVAGFAANLFGPVAAETVRKSAAPGK